MRYIAMLLVLLMAAAPLFAGKLKLRAEEAEFDATVLSFDGESVVYRKAARVGPLDDFEYASGFEIKKQFTPANGLSWQAFALGLHRGRTCRPRHGCGAVSWTAGHRPSASRGNVRSCRPTLLDRGNTALDAQRVEEARKLFRR